MIPFLYWLFLTPPGWTAFAAYLALTAYLAYRDPRPSRRPPLPEPVFDLELALRRRGPTWDVRNN